VLTDLAVDLNFLLGTSTVDVYIDNVTLKDAWPCDRIIQTGLLSQGVGV